MNSAGRDAADGRRVGDHLGTQPGAEARTHASDRQQLGYKHCEPTRRSSLEALNLGGYQHIAEDRLGDPYSIDTDMNGDSNRENQHLDALFADHFDPEGSEIHLKPASNYLVPGTEANLAAVIEAAHRRGETALGYRLARHGDEPPAYGVFLDPSKTAPLTLTAADAVVVLAEQ